MLGNLHSKALQVIYVTVPLNSVWEAQGPWKELTLGISGSGVESSLFDLDLTPAEPQFLYL